MAIEYGNEENIMDSIIFDVDGTLWDATPVVADAWRDLIHKEYDPDMEMNDTVLKGQFGKLLPDIARALFPKASPKRQSELLDMCIEVEHEALLATPPEPYPELEKVLQLLSPKYKLYIVSNCQAGYIEVFLKATGLGAYFEDHLCPGDTGNAKAANISEIVQKHNLQSAVYVGDTLGDYAATKEAGLPFVFADYGFGSVDEPDYTISKLMDLTTLFD